MRKFLTMTVILLFLLCYGVVQGHAASSRLCQIVFVPIGNFPEAALHKVANYYMKTLGIEITVTPIVPFEEPMIDRGRNQLVGEQLIEQMKRYFPAYADNPRILMIGFTRGDMYVQHKDWLFAFAHREDGRFAAISTARMDPESFGFPPDDRVLLSRLIKMTSKQIGLYFYELPQRDETTSVLFSPILGVDDLDAVAMDFDAVDRKRMGPTARRCTAN